MTDNRQSVSTQSGGSDVRPWGSLNWPNRISIVRLLLVAPFVVLVMNQNEPDWPWARHAALGIFVVMAFSDMLDGLLARRLNMRTRLGAMLDPLADKALVIWSVVLLSLKESAVAGSRLHNWVVVAVVGKDLWVIVGFIVVYLVTDRLRVRPTIAGKAATVGQLTMVITVLAAPDFNRLWPKLGTYMAWTMEYVVVGLSILAVVSYTRLGLSFVAQHGKPLDAHNHKTP